MIAPAIILAAGGSTRMGRPKQLLPYRGTTLLRHAVNAALDSRISDVLVVIGSQAAQMRAQISDLPVRIVSNPAWANGMGSSIRAGLSAVLADASAAGATPSAVVFMLCDQPAVTGDVLNQLIDRYERDNAPIVASFYDGVAGVPALFDRSLFEELLNLSDSSGARELIRRYGDRVARVPFPEGSVDVDTPQDYDRLK